MILLTVSSGCSRLMRKSSSASTSQVSATSGDGGTAPSNSVSSLPLSGYRISEVGVPTEIASTGDDPQSLVNLNGKLCYLALETVNVRKVFCLDSNGVPQKAFDLHPGVDDQIESLKVVQGSLFFQTSSSLGVFDGAHAQLLTTPSGSSFIWTSEVVGAGNGIYFFVGFDFIEKAGLYQYDGLQVTQLNPAGTPSVQSWSLLGAKGSRIYFYDNSSPFEFYSYSPTENGGFPFDLGRAAYVNFASRQDVPVFPDDYYFYAPDSSGNAVPFYIDETNLKIARVPGNYTSPGNWSFDHTQMLGTCFTAADSTNPNLGNGFLFCIDPKTRVARKALQALGSSRVNVIDGGPGLVYYLNGATGEIGSFDGSVYTHLLGASDGLFYPFMLGSSGKSLFIGQRDQSAEGKSLCPGGGLRIFNADLVSKTLTPISPGSVCQYSYAFRRGNLGDGSVVVADDFYYPTSSTQGWSTYNTPDFGNRTKIVFWSHGRTGTVPSALTGTHSSLVNSIGFSDHSIFGVGLSNVGDKVFSYSSGRWSQASDLYPGKSDGVFSLCGNGSEAFFASYLQDQESSGRSTLSRYDETTHQVTVIDSTQDWGLTYSLPCQTLAGKMVVQKLNRSSRSWETWVYDAGTLSQMGLSGDAVDHSSSPLNDLTEIGLIGSDLNLGYFTWPDQDGHQKLFSITAGGQTKQIADLFPGEDDSIANWVSFNGGIAVTAADASGKITVFSIKDGGVANLSDSLSELNETVAGNGPAILNQSDLKNQGIDLRLAVAGTRLFLGRNVVALDGTRSVRLFVWNGTSFIKISVPDSLQNFKFYGAVGERLLTSVVSQEGSKNLDSLLFLGSSGLSRIQGADTLGVSDAPYSGVVNGKPYLASGKGSFLSIYELSSP